jgi:hypothetical protein
MQEKLENIYEDSLDLIPSPSTSVTIQLITSQEFEFSLKMKVLGLNPGYLLKGYQSLKTLSVKKSSKKKVLINF